MKIVTPQVHRLTVGDTKLFYDMLGLFSREFIDKETYCANQPNQKYVERFLSTQTNVVLVAIEKEEVVGALVAYELPKFEQARSEFYIYDLAVDSNFRQRGIATSLINETRRIAKQQGGWVVMIQADYGDTPAINLYSKLGTPEEVLHFDIDPK